METLEQKIEQVENEKGDDEGILGKLIPMGSDVKANKKNARKRIAKKKDDDDDIPDVTDQVDLQPRYDAYSRSKKIAPKKKKGEMVLIHEQFLKHVEYIFSFKLCFLF